VSEPTTGTPAPSGGEVTPSGFEAECRSFFEQTSIVQTHVSEQLEAISKTVGQLYNAVSYQCNQLLQSDNNLVEELRKFQTGGPQRAMAGVYHKLMRDLVRYLASLDDLAALGEKGTRQPAEKAWIDAIRTARNSLEILVKDWGCEPIAVEPGKTKFDAQIHEAVPAEPGELSAGAAPHVVAKVRRRGWKLHESVLMYPQVVVGK
jgi:molecular chaperone GrpE (heat shock protein)